MAAAGLLGGQCGIVSGAHRFASALPALLVLHKSLDGLRGEADPCTYPLVRPSAIVELSGEIATALPCLGE
jgi:hypothetical protein